MQETARLQQNLANQLKKNDSLHSSRVEEAFLAVPRHHFVPNVPLERVYRDEALITKYDANHIGISSSSQPAIMAIMLEQLDLREGQRVLEIGTGTGFNAALIAHIVGEMGHVVTLDIDEDIVQNAHAHLHAAGFDQVQVICADGAYGFADAAPYDRIILTVGAADIAPAWLEQLKLGGILVLPLSMRGHQESIAFRRVNQHLESVSIRGCGFMPMRGTLADARRQISLGREPGLQIEVEDASGIEAEKIYEWLNHSHHFVSAEIKVTPREVFGGLSFWLALHEDGFFKISAMGAWVERNIVPPLFWWCNGENKSYSTIGVLDVSSVCVLTRPQAKIQDGDDCLASPPFELFVRTFGLDDSLRQHIIEQIHAWDNAGRPSARELRIKAYLSANEFIARQNEIAIDKKFAHLVLDWENK